MRDGVRGLDVCEFVFDDVAAGQLDLIGELVRSGMDGVLENETHGDDSGWRSWVCVLDGIEDGALDFVIEGVAVERAALKEDVEGVVAAAAERGVQDERGDVVRVLVAG